MSGSYYGGPICPGGEGNYLPNLEIEKAVCRTVGLTFAGGEGHGQLREEVRRAMPWLHSLPVPDPNWTDPAYNHRVPVLGGTGHMRHPTGRVDSRSAGPVESLGQHFLAIQHNC